MHGGSGFLGGAFEVEGEEAGEDFVVGEVGRPAVGGGDGGVEFLVRHVEPGGALVVEVRERALFEVGGAFGIAGFEARVADEADFGFWILNSGLLDVAVPRAADRAGKFQNFRPARFRV